MSCKDCKHFAVMAEDLGECRRNPPQVTHIMMNVPTGNVIEKRSQIVPQGVAGFPVVRSDQWCGEYFIKNKVNL